MARRFSRRIAPAAMATTARAKPRWLRRILQIRKPRQALPTPTSLKRSRTDGRGSSRQRRFPRLQPTYDRWAGPQRAASDVEVVALIAIAAAVGWMNAAR